MHSDVDMFDSSIANIELEPIREAAPKQSAALNLDIKPMKKKEVAKEKELHSSYFTLDSLTNVVDFKELNKICKDL